MHPITVDSRIRIPLAGLDEDVALRLRAATTHVNPEFKKQKAMGFLYTKAPEFIETWRFEDHHLTLPTGAMGRVRNAFREANIPFKLIDARHEGEAMSAKKPLMYCGLPLRGYQHEMIDKAFKKERCVIRASTGCLSGDTIVELNRAGKSFNCELRHLVKMFQGGRAANRTWDPEIDTRIRMRDGDGFIRLGAVTEAYSSGRKTTYLVETLGGKKLRATIDHRFMTEDGWKRLGKIAVGERVYVDNGEIGEGKARKSKSNYAVIFGMLHHPYSTRAAVSRNAPEKRRTCWKHRLVAEARLNHMSYARFVSRVRAGTIDGLVFLDPKEHHVHHIDENPKNNHPDNLTVMSPSKHHTEHGREGGWKKVTTRATLDTIIGISDPREEETFDVGIAEKEHNFLANGFVVHNSGKTTAAFALAAKVGLNTLVILPNAKLLAQWMKRAQTDLGLKANQVGIIRGNKRTLRALTLATQQTLWSRDVDDELKNFFGCVLVDEGHHLAANTFAKVIDAFPARYRIAFTADERRKDRKEFIIYDLIGEVAHEVSREECEAVGAIVDVDIRVVFTEFAFDMYRVDHNFNALLDGATNDDARNKIAIDLAMSEIKKGEQVIMLTHRREHARDIDRAMLARGVKSGCLLGTKERGDEEEFERMCAALIDGSARVGVGTYQALGEGIDLPAVSVGVAMTPIATNKQLFGQVRGRLCRTSAGKELGRLYVLFDRKIFDERVMRNLVAWNRTTHVQWQGKWITGKEYLKRSH